MPFKIKTFQRNVESRTRGATRQKLAKLCEDYTSIKAPRQKAAVIREMMNVLDREIGANTNVEIMAACGQACIGATTLAKAKRIKREADGIEDLLDRLNKAHIGGGHISLVGDRIQVVYNKCYCGSVSKTSEPFSSTYCHCSCGWLQQLFETLLDKPVTVKLLGSIIQGDDRCRFSIGLDRPKAL